MFYHMSVEALREGFVVQYALKRLHSVSVDVVPSDSH